MHSSSNELNQKKRMDMNHVSNEYFWDGGVIRSVNTAMQFADCFQFKRFHDFTNERFFCIDKQNCGQFIILKKNQSH